MDQDLRECLAGEPRAWEAFVHRWAGLIHTAVHRVLAGRTRGDVVELGQDTVQDVFVRLVKNDFALLRSFDPQRASMSTWLTIVSRSTAYDALRKCSLPTEPLSTVHQAVPAPPSDLGDPSATSIELPPGLLSPRQTLVLHLLFDKQWDVPQIARTLNIAEQTVRSTQHKALQKLRLHMKPKRPEESDPDGDVSP
ncbi:MAG: sigma-70 family RNA polymerase sigma factor [Phycisphaeraceae bacterium]